MTRVLVNTQTDAFMSAKYIQNIQILWCDHRYQWTTSSILGQDASTHPRFGLWRKHCIWLRFKPTMLISYLFAFIV